MSFSDAQIIQDAKEKFWFNEGYKQGVKRTINTIEQHKERYNNDAIIQGLENLKVALLNWARSHGVVI